MQVTSAPQEETRPLPADRTACGVRLNDTEFPVYIVQWRFDNPYCGAFSGGQRRLDYGETQPLGGVFSPHFPPVNLIGHLMTFVLYCRRPWSVFALLLVLAAGSAESIAAEPESADPVAMAANPDFAIQGEYVGQERGMQVIAVGDGEFDIVVYEGGLPAAGATTKEPRRIEGDADTVLQIAESMELKKVIRRSKTLGAQPPVGAIVLFDGTADSASANWDNGRVTDSGLLMEGTSSKQKFRDYRLHLEFRTPFMPTASGQQRGNSGVYHQGRYETQILDSFGLEGKDNETGGIYTVSAPSVNACFPPLSWQTYDVEFTAARYDTTGNKTADARITVRLNGVLVQSDVELTKSTTAAKLKAGPEPGPIYLQNHKNPVRFQNIWVLPIDSAREAQRPIVPGFERFFAGGSEPSAVGGELLISSLACDACHSGDTFGGLATKRGPNLSDVGSRVRIDAIHAMIANPHETKTGTSMPDPWTGLTTQQRDERSAAITSFLVQAGANVHDQTASEKTVVAGRKLYHSIGCIACHESFDATKTPSSTTVQLGQLAKKYSLTSLSSFLQNPHDVRSGLRMPALTGSVDEARKIAAFLLRDVVQSEPTATLRRQIFHGEWDKLPDFSKLTPVSEDQVIGLLWQDLERKNSYAIVYTADLNITSDGEYEFRLMSDDGSRLIIGDKVLNNDGIHAEQTRSIKLSLKRGVHPIRIEFFQGGGGAALEVDVIAPALGAIELARMLFDPDNPTPSELVPSKFTGCPELVDRGRELFKTSGCVNCHAFGTDLRASVRPPGLAALDVTKGCLSENVPAPAFDFRLNPIQRAAITAAINQRDAGGVASIDDKTQIHVTMAALNCYACHDRDSIGGRELQRDELFGSSTPEMGLEGRLPPSLTGVGDKLKDDYFKTIMQHGAAERPYMRTRMPGYRSEPLQELVDAFVKLDRPSDSPESPPKLLPANDKKSHTQIANKGRLCVGNRGLACIKCHSFRGDKGGGIGAIDMLKMTQRLRPDWFHRYLMDPPKYRPGTRMPKSFVDGKSALTKVYEGDPARQIEAMWSYLSAGKNAKDPEGLRINAILLAAGERPLIYRNFFTDVSPRGIGVTYPGDSSLIWDAEQMGFARIWKNGFIDASLHWVNRGQGNQSPLGDTIVNVDQGAPLALLSSVDADWPQASARSRGVHFKGFKLNSDGEPAFRYKMNGCEVTDHVTFTEATDSTEMRRTLSFTHSPVDVDQWARQSVSDATLDAERSSTADADDSSAATDSAENASDELVDAEPSEAVVDPESPTSDLPELAVADPNLVWLVARGDITVQADGSYLIADGATLRVEGCECQLIETESGKQLRAVITPDVTRVSQIILW